MMDLTSKSDETDDDFYFGSPDIVASWIDFHCDTKRYQYLIRVDEDFIRDEFNLKGLHQYIPNFKAAHSRILDDVYSVSNLDITLEKCALALYGLIHARFILTPTGMERMTYLYDAFTFGFCANASCVNIPVMPIGLSDIPSRSGVKVLCPRCNEIYDTNDSDLAVLDGAFYGTSFAELFFLHLHMSRNEADSYYRPQIYGFRVSQNVKDILRKKYGVEYSGNDSSDLTRRLKRMSEPMKFL